MISFLQALWEHSFLQLSLIVTLAACISGALMGTYVVVRRISFLAGAIGHTVLGGLGICLYLQRVHGLWWCDPWWGALIAALATSALLSWIEGRFQQRADALIGVLWASGMALGIICLHLTPGSQSETLGFLFGNVLWVAQGDLWLLLALNALLLFALIGLHPRLVCLCFDEDQARLQGIPTKALSQALLLLIGLTTVVLTAVVGSVLVMALLTIPPSISALLTRRISSMLMCAAAVAVTIGASGMAISYPLDWPPGATIAILAGMSYGLVLLGRQLMPTIFKRLRQLQGGACS